MHVCATVHSMQACYACVLSDTWRYINVINTFMYWCAIMHVHIYLFADKCVHVSIVVWCLCDKLQYCILLSLSALSSQTTAILLWYTLFACFVSRGEIFSQRTPEKAWHDDCVVCVSWLVWVYGRLRVNQWCWELCLISPLWGLVVLWPLRGRPIGLSVRV